MKAKLLLTIIVATIFGGLTAGSAHATGTAGFSLSPASGTYYKGDSFTVQIYENGDNVNAVQAKLTYDAAKLSCDSAGGDSAFPSIAFAYCSDGTVEISRFMNGTATVSGSQLVGSMTFTALVDTGSAVINFIAPVMDGEKVVAPGTRIASNGADVWNGNTAGGTYSFAAIPAPVPPAPDPTPTPVVVTPTSTSTPTAKKTTATTSSITSNAPIAAATPTITAVADDSKGEVAAATDIKDKTNDKKKDSTSMVAATKADTNNGWLWMFALLAVVAGFMAIRQSRVDQIAASQSTVEESALAAQTKETKNTSNYDKKSQNRRSKGGKGGSRR
jgi:hypothetical protein